MPLSPSSFFDPAWPPYLQVMGILLAGPIFMVARYLIIAGSAYGATLFIDRKSPWRRLQPQGFTFAQIRREIGYSLITSVIFAAVFASLFLLKGTGLTKIYSDPLAYGQVWFWLQIPVVLAIQDFYFYWMHRTVHKDGLYDTVHRVHHLSVNPSPFAAFAFHPLEAVLEIGFIVPLALVMPLTFKALFWVSLLSLLYNVYGHLGYEIMPNWLARTPLGKLFNTATYHNQHHRTYRYNYGLYTTVWDRLFRTMHPKADALIEHTSVRAARPLGREA